MWTTLTYGPLGGECLILQVLCGYLEDDHSLAVRA